MGLRLVGKIAEKHLGKVLGIWKPATTYAINLCTSQVIRDGVAVPKASLATLSRVLQLFLFTGDSSVWQKGWFSLKLNLSFTRAN